MSERVFRVMRKRCNECLFSDARIVTDAGKDDVLNQCWRTDTHFICHKATIANMQGVLTEEESNVCCRGFYDFDPYATLFMRLAHELNAVVFVDVPEVKEDKADQ